MICHLSCSFTPLEHGMREQKNSSEIMVHLASVDIALILSCLCEWFDFAKLAVLSRAFSHVIPSCEAEFWKDVAKLQQRKNKSFLPRSPDRRRSGNILYRNICVCYYIYYGSEDYRHLEWAESVERVLGLLYYTHLGITEMLISSFQEMEEICIQKK